MKKIILFLLISVCIFGQNNLRFDFDHAQFGLSDSTNYLELYYSVKQNTLTLYKIDAGNEIAMKVQFSLLDNETKEYVVNKTWMVKQSIADTSAMENLFTGLTGFAVSEGNYTMLIKAYDSQDSTKDFSQEKSISITPLKNNKRIGISEVEFARKIMQDYEDKTSLFYKNTMLVFPNPSNVFSNTTPIIFYYLELYGLDNIKADYVYLNRVVKNNKNQIIDKKSKKIGAKNSDIVEAGFFDMQKYPTGSYSAEFTLIDSTTGNGIQSNKKFFFVNPGVKEELLDVKLNAEYLGTEFGAMSVEELDDLFAKSKYLSTADEIEFYNALNELEAKREFMHKFWKKRDDDLTTDYVEFKDVYLSRIEYANRRFGNQVKKGYRTDRGRAYAIWGEPDEIDRYPNESNMKPYEIWVYNSIEGGVYFVFGDVSGFGDYEQLTSTMRGEIRDEYWERRLYNN